MIMIPGGSRGDKALPRTAYNGQRDT